MGSILGQDPSSVQVSRKSVQQFLCNPAHKPTNQQQKQGENITSLEEVKKLVLEIKYFTLTSTT